MKIFNKVTLPALVGVIGLCFSVQIDASAPGRYKLVQTAPARERVRIENLLPFAISVVMRCPRESVLQQTVPAAQGNRPGAFVPPAGFTITNIRSLGGQELIVPPLSLKTGIYRISSDNAVPAPRPQRVVPQQAPVAPQPQRAVPQPVRPQPARPVAPQPVHVAPQLQTAAPHPVRPVLQPVRPVQPPARPQPAAPQRPVQQPVRPTQQPVQPAQQPAVGPDQKIINLSRLKRANDILDLNDNEAYTTYSFNELIDDQTKKRLPFILARVTEAQSPRVFYFDAHELNKDMFKGYPIMPNQNKWKLQGSHIVRNDGGIALNPLNRNPITVERIDYFIINSMQDPQFTYFASFNDVITKPEIQNQLYRNAGFVHGR